MKWREEPRPKLLLPIGVINAHEWIERCPAANELTYPEHMPHAIDEIVGESYDALRAVISVVSGLATAFQTGLPPRALIHELCWWPEHLIRPALAFLDEFWTSLDIICHVSEQEWPAESHNEHHAAAIAAVMGAVPVTKAFAAALAHEDRSPDPNS